MHVVDNLQLLAFHSIDTQLDMESQIAWHSERESHVLRVAISFLPMQP